MGKHRVRTLQTVATGWTETLLICGKCSRKLGGGFGPEGDDSLRHALRDALRRAGRRGQVGLIDVACLGICPKKGVTMARASRPGEFLVVPRGQDAATLIG